jgi:hypothetical protein
MLHAEILIQEAPLTSTATRKKRIQLAEPLIPPGSTMSDLKPSFLAVLFHQRSLSVHILVRVEIYLQAIIQLAIEWLRLEEVLAEHIE